MREYDAAVVGAGLGGLTAAALLSVKGKKVVVSTAASSLPEALGMAEKDGFLFCPGPALTYGYEPDGAFRRLFNDLNVGYMAPDRPARYHVALPDRRIAVSADREETLEELGREFPGEFRAIVKFYRDLGKETERAAKSRLYAFVYRRRSAEAFLRAYDFSAALRAFFDVQSLYFFQRPCAGLSLPMLAAVCSGRPQYSAGAGVKLAEQLAAAVLRKGGDVRFNEPAPELVFRHKRVAGVKIANDEVKIKSILLGTTEGSTHCLFLGIREEVVPAGMWRDVLYLPDYAKPREFLACSLSAGGDAAVAPRGMRSLAAAFYSQHGRVHDKDELIGRVAGLIPFLRDFLVITGESRAPEPASVPPGLTFRPLDPREGEPLLYKASVKKLYLLHEVQQAPLGVIPAARRLAERMA